MTKRKVTYVAEDEDFNDGSDSDDSDTGYVPRVGVDRIHHVPEESISVAVDG